MNFWNLDNNDTYQVLSSVSWMNGWQNMEPDRSGLWTENLMHVIARDDELWEAYSFQWKATTGKTLNLTDWCRSLSIVAGVFMQHTDGPEGDGQHQMLRKHWYAWGKLGLQPAAIRLGTALQENGEPDSEKLNALMSKTFGEWNEAGLMEYRDFYILNDSSKMVIFENTLPSPYHCVIVCCEKDAAFQGVALSAAAMGARAVYSGGGKSSRSGIEKLFHNAIENKMGKYDTLYVLVISDYDMDGEAVIAPTFVEQLATYVPRDQIQWRRVGVTPEEVEEIRGGWEEASYVIKWDVNGAIHYYQWAAEKSILRYECADCGEPVYAIGAKCPHCQTNQIVFDLQQQGYDIYEIAEIDQRDRDEVSAVKDSFKRFFTENSPKGFELDALTRVQYCDLLLREGLLTLVNYDELLQALSDNARPRASSVGWALASDLLDGNQSYVNLKGYKYELEEWFRKQTAQLDELQARIEREAEEEGRRLADFVEPDELIGEEDWPGHESYTEWMKKAEPMMGSCRYCGTNIKNCRNPQQHQQYGYWQDAPATIEGQLSSVRPWHPFSADDRETTWAERVRAIYEEDIQAWQDKTFTWQRLNLSSNDA